MELISPAKSVGTCLLLSVIYVASLYMWNSKENRDHPSTILKRFLSVFLVMSVSPVFLYVVSSQSLLTRVTLWEAMGFRRDGILMAFVIPLCLTALLFLGPISMQVFSGMWRLYFRPTYWFSSFCNILWLRNHVVAPLSEEFTFRACMLPLLLQSFSPTAAIFLVPLFFAVAHFHHIIERLRTGMDVKTAVTMSCFQFTYTYIFGIYSAYLFTKTGHFVAPFVAHAFCNHMGFPDVMELTSHPRKHLLQFLYVLGLVSWILLLPIATAPTIYANHLYAQQL
ncbi:CAAX prenyl protease 2 [Phlebotomus argentipes]|uniref:CAAX prenyl protease 2 n=1 Tax=Phlebotomus argentipes TaxID=94469 RepID=UPI002892E73E|nr:CAAX prenyl protease 2 [Phlebotomus argentipes]